MNWTVTSGNRTAAKRLLNTWHDSKQVRTWTLDTLTQALRRAVSDGLITDAGINRALDDGPNSWRPMSHDAQPSNGSSSASVPDDTSYADIDNTLDTDPDSDDAGDDAPSDDDTSDDSSSDDNDTPDTDSSDDAAPDDDTQDDNDDGIIRHAMFDVVRKYIKAGMPVALVGPTGSGKSVLALQVAEDLGLTFKTHGAVMSKYDLIGYNDANGVYHPTPAYEAATDGGLFCFDEFDASAPEAGVAFNGLTDGQPTYSWPCGQLPKHEDFRAIATMNTWGNGATADYVGRFKQDAASMSRFVRVLIDYDLRVERRIAGKKHADVLKRAHAIRKACADLAIRHITSTRTIATACRALDAGVSKSDVDRDIFFAGLDDAAIAQVKTHIKGN